METIVQNIWRRTGSIRLTTALFVAAIVDLLAGYSQLKAHPHLFNPINDLGFVRWSLTYGKTHQLQTLWLFILVALLALISLNTFVCTTERVAFLVRRRGFRHGKINLLLKLSPHIMHYGMLVMLAGYLVSYLGAESHVCSVLLPGKQIAVPGSTCRIRLNNLTCDFYEGERLSYMIDRTIRIRADLTVKDGSRAKAGTLGMNRPVWFFPYSIHLKDFAPKSKGSTSRRPHLRVIVKKDPGVIFYFGGMAVFVVGLALYLAQRAADRKKKEITP